MNNILDLSKKENQQFIASIIAVLCENHPITIRIEDVEKYWYGEIQRLQYDMVMDVGSNTGSITFSLKDEK